MTSRAVIAIVFVALVIFGGILYFSEFAPSDISPTYKNTNAAPVIHDDCSQRCINRGFAEGQCMRATATESVGICVDQQGTAVENTNIPIPDCNYQTEAETDVCCCF